MADDSFGLIPMGHIPSFALIVVNFGSSALLKQNLSGLDIRAHGGMVVIVDNFTTSAERRAVQTLAATEGWVVVPLDDNRGFGGGVNAGARYAIEHEREVLVALNPDARIGVHGLMRLVTAAAATADLMVAPVIKTGSGAIWFDGIDLFLDSGRVASRRRKMPPPGPRQPWISGACFAISCSMWERVGGFDEEYFLYWEDVDLSRRVVLSGGSLAVLDDVFAVHDEGGTQKSARKAGAKSETYYYYNIRNRLVYAAKHCDDRRIKLWQRSTARVSYEILLGGGRRQFLHSLAPIRAYVRGIRDGRRMLAEIRSRKRSER
ncbi:glycosyltransferase family 2 protein [Microbacterium sp. STN6]|uniref:glycosyltransferase family 2 protein n=1 Tax=Microbacterium sp. STN6 TaxID=2995588 RepID=UPI002260EAA4|nr:glycosyltransferase family 2 protein [Microbacterium sp. STN6]MCX7523030.1 glycosyltransferase family 2 protein [Microbacterium sp. STN6]